MKKKNKKSTDPAYKSIHSVECYKTTSLILAVFFFFFFFCLTKHGGKFHKISVGMCITSVISAGYCFDCVLVIVNRIKLH